MIWSWHWSPLWGGVGYHENHHLGHALVKPTDKSLLQRSGGIFAIVDQCTKDVLQRMILADVADQCSSLIGCTRSQISF